MVKEGWLRIATIEFSDKKVFPHIPLKDNVTVPSVEAIYGNIHGDTIEESGESFKYQ